MTTNSTYKVIILAYPGMTLLDAIGPNEVLANSPLFDVKFVTTQTDPISNDHNNLTLCGVSHYKQVESADILIIPGGPGEHQCMQDAKLLAWIKKIDKTTTLTSSVCTGSLILAATGLLENVKVCCHWACLEELKPFGAIPQRKRFIHHKKYVTASGVSAGIDMALYLVKHLVSAHHAKQLRFGIEYFPNQYHLLSSYSMPEFLLRRLSLKVQHVIQATRLKVAKL